jgi:hypothetical protein
MHLCTYSAACIENNTKPAHIIHTFATIRFISLILFMKKAVEGSLLRYNARSLVIKSLLLQPLRIFYGQNFIQYKKRNISRTQGERWYRKKAITEEKKL